MPKPSTDTASTSKKPARKSTRTEQITIEAQGIAASKVKVLKDFLSEHLDDKVKIRVEGKKLSLKSVEGQKISKTLLKPYLKRFLYQQNLRTSVRVLTAGREGLMLYQPGYIEESESPSGS